MTEVAQKLAGRNRGKPVQALEFLFVSVFAALPPVLTVARVSPPLFLGLAAVFLAGLAWCYREQAMFEGLGSKIRSPLLLAGLACTAFMLISVTWAPVPVQARGLSSAWGFLFSVLVSGLLWLCVCALPVPVLDRLAGRIGAALAISLPLTAVLIFVHFLTGGVLNAELRADPDNYVLNRAALAIAMFLPFAALVVLKQRRRLPLAGLLVFAAVSCFQSDSSSAQLGVLVILLLTVPAFVWPRAIYRVVTGGALVTFVLMPLIVGHVNDMIPQAVHEKVGYTSLTIRGLIWTEYANLLPGHVWLGYGMEASKVADELPEAAGYSPERKYLLGFGHSHNAPLQIWFELGLAGAALFAAALALLFRRAGHLQGASLAAATVTLAVTYSVAVVSHGAWQGWWFSLMILTAVPFMVKGRAEAVRSAPELAAGSQSA